MQTTRMLQAVILVMIVALAASCAASKEYTSKLFPVRNEFVKDSQSTALRFLELDDLQPGQEDWVTTDIIMGRDTISKTVALDKLAKIFPAAPAGIDSASTRKEDSPATQPGQTAPVFADIKPVPIAEPPVARNMNTGEVRNKRTREK